MTDVEVHVERHTDGGVLWVDILCREQKVSLGGYCRYWYTDDSMGGYGCVDHGYPPVSYSWDGQRFVKGTSMPPPGVEVEEGSWLPDDQWKKVRS